MVMAEPWSFRRGDFMRVGAHVEICGRLGTDMEIKYTSSDKRYGVLSIAVSRRAGVISDTGKPLYKVNWYKAIIWDEKILSKQHSLLKKGKKILLRGELEVLPAIEPNQSTQLLICVRSKSGGVSVLAEPGAFDGLEEGSDAVDESITEDDGSIISELIPNN
jgi:hypothetical protein